MCCACRQGYLHLTVATLVKVGLLQVAVEITLTLATHSKPVRRLLTCSHPVELQDREPAGPDIQHLAVLFCMSCAGAAKHPAERGGPSSPGM